MNRMREIAELLREGEYRPNGCYLVRSSRTGKVLVTQSPEECKLGEWAFPQGGFERTDESVDENVYRELEEETNIRPHEISSIDADFHHPFIQDFSAERIAKEKAKRRNFRGKKYFPVLVEYDGDDYLDTSSGEIQNYQWVDVETAKGLVIMNSSKGKSLYGMLSEIG